MKEGISYKPLINSWEEYLKSGGPATMEAFARYILSTEKKDDFVESSIENPHNPPYDGPYLTAEAGEIISRLYKFAKFYSKPVLQEVGLASPDEFVILAALYQVGESGKKQIVLDNMIELTTGIDMIRRLVKQGLLKEKVNPEDKRAKLVSLSPKGQRILFEVVSEFSKLEDVLGDLDRKEREQLIRTLKRLDEYHTHRVVGVR